jgi:hypothetical protein
MKENKKHLSIEEYFENQPERTKEVLKKLKECILIAAPEAIEMFNYDIPAYAFVKGGKIVRHYSDLSVVNAALLINEFFRLSINFLSSSEDEISLNPTNSLFITIRLEFVLPDLTF